MTTRKNEFDQPIGDKLDFTGPWPTPDGRVLVGRTTTLRRANLDYAPDLFKSYKTDETGKNWTYMPTSPTGDLAAFKDWYTNTCLKDDPFFYTVFDKDDRPVGQASYLRITPAAGSIEVGWIAMSPLMQRSVISTEAMYLMMAHVFEDMGYRRYEWKCDNLNAPSRSAAQRLGFTFEGVFRQCTTYKGRNRDTAWFSILDHEWPAQKDKFLRYLDPSNFDENGQQIKRLND